MPAIARRYAEAYFALATEANAVDVWRRELARAVETLTNPEVGGALANPRLPISDRVRLALDLLDGSSPEVRNLARLLVERHRTAEAGELLSEYDRLADAARGVVRIEVTTAVPPTDDVKQRIESTLSERFGKAAQITLMHDPEIIGGLIVRIGDRVIDGSVRTHLQQLQAALA